MTSMNSLFPSCALSKMKTKYKFRICRAFDVVTKKNHFGLILMDAPTSRRFYLYAFDEYNLESVLYASLANARLIELERADYYYSTSTFVQLLLDNQAVTGDIIHPGHDANERLGFRELANTSSWLHALLLFAGILLPFIPFSFPLPNQAKCAVHLCILALCYVGFVGTCQCFACGREIDAALSIGGGVGLGTFICIVIDGSLQIYK